MWPVLRVSQRERIPPNGSKMEAMCVKSTTVVKKNNRKKQNVSPYCLCGVIQASK